MSASFASCTLAPVARESIATRGTFFHGRFGGLTSTPCLRSIGPGAAMVMLRTFSRPRCLSISAAAQSTIAWGVPSNGVFVFTLAMTFPSERASATRTCVPPRSIPASIPEWTVTAGRAAGRGRRIEFRVSARKRPISTRQYVVSARKLEDSESRYQLRSKQLLAAQGGEDLDRAARAVERVEVEPRNPCFQQFDTLRDAVLHPQDPHGVVVRRLLDRRLQSSRHGCP